MFGWLQSLLARFRPADRCLFCYWDGVKQRSIDPIVAHRGLWTDLECRFIEDGPVSCNPKDHDGNPVYPIAEVLAAEDRVRDLGRRVFGVKPYSDQQSGLTCLEVDELMSRFVVFSEDVKKKLSPSRISSEPTDSTVPYGSPAMPSSPDGLPLDSSFLPIASSDVGPIG